MKPVTRYSTTRAVLKCDADTPPIEGWSLYSSLLLNLGVPIAKVEVILSFKKKMVSSAWFSREPLSWHPATLMCGGWETLWGGSL